MEDSGNRRDGLASMKRHKESFSSLNESFSSLHTIDSTKGVSSFSFEA
jgi:hypothetical protein